MKCSRHFAFRFRSWYVTFQMAKAQATNVGRRIREARDALGLSQVDFAEWLGYSERAIQSWERNERTPRPRQLESIAARTNRSVAWFWSVEDDDKAVA